MKLCINDPVIILDGKDKGKEGVISKILRKEGKVVVDGMNKHTRHIKSREGMEGGRKEFSAPLDVSNVAYKDPKSGKPTKIGYVIKGTEKIRIAKDSGEMIPPKGKGKFISLTITA